MSKFELGRQIQQIKYVLSIVEQNRFLKLRKIGNPIQRAVINLGPDIYDEELKEQLLTIKVLRGCCCLNELERLYNEAVGKALEEWSSILIKRLEDLESLGDDK